jgi:hypothetical protein
MRAVSHSIQTLLLASDRPIAKLGAAANAACSVGETVDRNPDLFAICRATQIAFHICGFHRLSLDLLAL